MEKGMDASCVAQGHHYTDLMEWAWQSRSLLPWSMRPNDDNKHFLLLALWTPTVFPFIVVHVQVKTHSSHESSPCLLFFCFVRFPTECWFTPQFQLLLFLIMTRITVIITKAWPGVGWQLTAVHGLERAQTEFATSTHFSVGVFWKCVCVCVCVCTGVCHHITHAD